MKRKARVLFVYPHEATFIQKDMEMLKESFDVFPFVFRGKGDIPRLARKVAWSDLTFSWFIQNQAAVAVLFSKLFFKKSIVLAGGWGVVAMPEIGYGAMLNKKMRKRGCWTLKNASRVIAVSESTKKWILKWVKRDDVITIHHGFDAEFFLPGKEKEKLVVTIARLISGLSIKIKGMEHFLKAAELLPDVRFLLIGDHYPDYLKKWNEKAPPNLEILGIQSQEKLAEYFRRAKVYAQPSYQESFGCALAEAMLCECVPVVTDRGAIPEVVGDTGFYAEYGNPEDLASTIKEALASDKGPLARDRIKKLYPLSMRKEKLTDIILDSLGR